MPALGESFEERLAEIETYLDLLGGIQQAAQSGVPRIGVDGIVITTQQQRILHSSVFLLLYNLVEATIVRCMEAVTQAALTAGSWMPADLTDNLRKEWVRAMAATHREMNPETRLDHALTLCRHLVSALPVGSFKVEKSGGSWDDAAIEAIAVRLGFQLQVSQDSYRAIKRVYRNDHGALVYVMKLRNNLAHGSISFAQCSEDVTVSDLRDLTDRTSAYLREVVVAFNGFIERHEFVVPERRPA